MLIPGNRRGRIWVSIYLEIKQFVKKQYPVYDDSGKLICPKENDMCAVDDLSFFH